MRIYSVEEKTLSNIADAIRGKTGKSESMTVNEMVGEIESITGGGGIDTSDATATASDIISGKTAYIDGEKITGTIPTKSASNLTASGATVTVPAGYYASQATKSVVTATQATPSISVDSAGKITASATQTAGYVAAGTKTGTKQLTTQAAKTVTPTKSSQTAVASGVYTTGAITVAAIPSNYITTTDATAAADDIVEGETAYVNGEKITGTFTINSELSTQDDLIAQIQMALKGKASSAPAELILQTKTVNPSTSSQTVTPDNGYDGLSQVTVNAIPSGYIVPSGTKTITTNGTYDVKSYASATVNVAGSGGNSGSVETCTINFSIPCNSIIKYTAYSNINNSYTFETATKSASSFSISNVVCNTGITVALNSMNSFTYNTTGTIVVDRNDSLFGYVQCAFLHATDTSGGTINITASTGGY